MSRELLEKAAKAAGITLQRERSDGLFDILESPGIWNPLTDDGDAFRLVVKLQFKVKVYPDMVSVYGSTHYGADQAIDGDPYAATRLAIVRAAAAMGEKL